MVLHTPDGGALFIESTHIGAVRPISEAHVEHVAAGTKAVVYTLDKNFGVLEEAKDVVSEIEACQLK